MIVGPKADPSENERLGSLLQSLRENARLSRRKVAENLEITSEYLRLIERGKRTPAQGLMPFFAVLYGTTCSIRGNQVIFGSVVIEFTSRIKETRGRKLTDNVGRAERIGQIVQILDLVDDETLAKVYSLLQRKKDKG